MKKNSLLLSVVFGWLSLTYAQDHIIFQGIPDSIKGKRYDNLFAYRSQINFPPFIGWSPNGKKMLFNGGKALYSMASFKSEIREYKIATQSFGTTIAPDYESFLYQKDNDGDENYQLFYVDLSKNLNIPLSKKGHKTYDSYWSPNSERIVYKSNKVHPKIVDLYIRNIKTPSEERLIFKDFSDDGLIYDWSLEKGLILGVKVISENDKSLYLIDDSSYDIAQINPSKSNIAYAGAKFIPNQNACLIISDEFSEFLQLNYYDLSTKQFKTITNNIPWDVESISIDKNGHYAAFSTNENGFSKLYILDLKTLAYRQVNDFPEGHIKQLRMNSKGTQVGFNFYSSTFRRKVYGYDIKKDRLNHYTRRGEKQNDSINFRKAEHFSYTSIDSDTGEAFNIPAFIYKSKNQSAPVLIEIHGGPEYQIRSTFNGFYQYLVNELGISVIVPNIRGSNGYGKSYMKMDDQWNRENAIEDVGALLDWIATQEDLDAERVAIYGESYGGYVTLSSLAHYSDRLKCGIDIVGISDWVNYLNHTSDYRKDLRRVEFGDERDPKMKAFLDKISPVNNVHKINSPLLIFQGMNDPRVHYSESEKIYETLKAEGKAAWYVLAKNEGHGFHHFDNYKLQLNLIMAFLEKHLLLK